MASAYYSSIADNYFYEFIFELSMESSKYSVSLNAQPLGFTACLKPSEVETSASTDDRQFQLTPPINQFSLSGRTTNLFDNEAFFSLKKFLPYSKQMIDLTFDSDGDNDDEDAIEVG
jgi:hypothetical protein